MKKHEVLPFAGAVTWTSPAATAQPSGSQAEREEPCDPPSVGHQEQLDSQRQKDWARPGAGSGGSSGPAVGLRLGSEGSDFQFGVTEKFWRRMGVSVARTVNGRQAIPCFRAVEAVDLVLRVFYREEQTAGGS